MYCSLLNFLNTLFRCACFCNHWFVTRASISKTLPSKSTPSVWSSAAYARRLVCSACYAQWRITRAERAAVVIRTPTRPVRQHLVRLQVEGDDFEFSIFIHAKEVRTLSAKEFFSKKGKWNKWNPFSNIQQQYGVGLNSDESHKFEWRKKLCVLKRFTRSYKEMQHEQHSLKAETIMVFLTIG